MSHSENELGRITVLLAILLPIGFIVWIMQIFDVPSNVASDTVMKLIGWGGGAAGLVIWQVKSGLHVIKFIAPFMISLFWCCLIPILDYKAGVRNDTHLRLHIDWYGTASWQFLIFLTINIIGYGIIYLSYRRNNYY